MKPALAVEADANSVAQVRKWVLAASDLVKSVSTDDPMGTLLSKIAAQGQLLLHLDMCAVMFVDETGHQLLVRGSAGLSGNYVERLNTDHPLLVNSPFGMTPSPSVQAFLTGETITEVDVSASPRFSVWKDLAAKEGYISMLATPLYNGDERVGVLVGYSSERREFTANHIELLNLLAEHVGTTLQAAYLRATGQTIIQELHAANIELTAQRQSLEIAERQHRQLMQVMSNEVGVEGVVKMIADALQTSVTLEDTTGSLIVEASANAQVRPPDHLMHQRTGLVDLDLRASTGSAWIIAPVTLGGEVVARLWVHAPGEPIDDVNRRGIERFAMALALELSKQRSALHVRLSLSRDLMSDLLTPTKDADRQALLERALAMGHDLTLPHTLIVARIDSSNQSNTAPGITLIQTTSSLVRRRGLVAMVGGTEQEVILLVPNASQGELPPLAQELLLDFQRTNNGRTCSAIIGDSCPDIRDLPGAYRSAHGALELLSKGRKNSVLTTADLGVASVLLSHGDSSALIDFAHRVLGPLLVSANTAKGQELIDTLRCWLTCDCSTGLAAERLSVHANTVIYRLKTIEGLLGSSLRSPTFLTQVELAMKILDVVGVQQIS